MRSLRLVAIAAVLCLACSDSTAPSLQGPSFMRASINGRPFVVDENGHGAFMLGWNETGLLVQVGYRLDSASPVEFISLEIHNYHGPDTYALGETGNPGPVSVGSYSVVAGDPPVVGQSYQTGGSYKGTVNVTAFDTTLASIAGTFAFSAAATSGTGVVHITGGSFRVHPQ